MGKHQIIYTSCMRGINGVNDGQQVFSYNADFHDSSSDDVKSLFTYQIPSLDPGVLMTEDLAETMPQSFTYRKLGNGQCAVVLNTYLGRDYMGSAGRFGNHLSHALICNENEFYCYPCEIYGSEALRNHMEFNEVNNPERPPYLPTPDLNKGYIIDVDSVIEFLSIDDRMFIFKKMLASMLAFETARKRVVICDEKDNIIKWIAALQFALPLKIALNINFTTYEFDPSLSSSQICGVIPTGSRYSPNIASQHFTFDIFQGIVPDIKADGEFFDFIDMGLSLSYESLEVFYEFITTKLNYSKADEQYYHVYSLYSLLSDGIEALPLESFKNAVKVTEFLVENEKGALTQRLLEQREAVLETDYAYSIEIINTILDSFGMLSLQMKEQTKALIIDRIITGFTSPEVNKNEFISFYHVIGDLSSTKGISIPYELMKDDNRAKLLDIMKNESATWKWEFILDALCGFVLQKPIPPNELSMDYPVGSLICGIVEIGYSLSQSTGFSLTTKIIDKFSHDSYYLINMALNLEGILFDVPDADKNVSAHWKYVYQVIAKKQKLTVKVIYSVLLKYDRVEQVFDIYSELMYSAEDISFAKQLFMEQLGLSNSAYLSQYQAKIIEAYYDYLGDQRGTEAKAAKRELLKKIMQNCISVSFVNALVENILNDIPLEALSKDNQRLVSELWDYYVKVAKIGIKGRLLLLVIGALLDEIKNHKELTDFLRQIRKVTGNNQVNLSAIGEVNVEKYLDWILPKIFNCCEEINELIECYELFRLSNAGSTYFISLCAKEALKESKNDKNYSSTIVFLEFLFSVGKSNDREETGKIFCKLNKQRLEELDLAVKDQFKNNKTYISYWHKINETAASTNPLLNNLSNFFKRKKD